jgi:2-oxoacid:acceptor oxidoreductase gamma subunit (pyruvate/2-ketoisovalerate family)
MIEIRWHARAGQGAKTAAQLLAEAALRSGKSAQAFPEYGPERRGAPMRAYTRVDDRTIRRHDAVTRPNIVVVLEPSLVREIDVAEGLADDGVVLVNAAEPPPELCDVRVVCVPAQGNVNVTLAGAAAALVGTPPERVTNAALELLGKKVSKGALRAAVEEGYRCLS